MTGVIKVAIVDIFNVACCESVCSFSVYEQVKATRAHSNAVIMVLTPGVTFAVK